MKMMCLNVKNQTAIEDFCQLVLDEDISSEFIKVVCLLESPVNMVVERHMLPTKWLDYTKEHVNKIQTGK